MINEMQQETGITSTALNGSNKLPETNPVEQKK